MKEFRCTEEGCKKLLGKIDEEGTFHFSSKRSMTDITFENGVVSCKNIREHYLTKIKSYKFEKIKMEQ